MTDQATTEGAYVTFSGDSGAVLIDIPELGDIVTMTVKGKAVTDKDQARKDGEIRRTITLNLIDVVPGEIEKAPRDPQLVLGEGDEEL